MVGDKEKIEELFATWLAQNAPSCPENSKVML